MAALTAEPTYTEKDLSGMTKAQLLDAAQDLGVEGVSTANTKAEITSAILEVI